MKDTAQVEKISFKFPFQPYKIQENYMNFMYRIIDERRVGLLESPTGTGKSMSIICSLGKWLNEQRYRCLEEPPPDLKQINIVDDWLTTQIHNKKVDKINRKREALDDMEASLKRLQDEPNSKKADIEECSNKVSKHKHKVFYISRTYTQLCQFLEEFKKSPYSEEFKVSIAYSRDKVCLNEKVSNLRNHKLQNTRCQSISTSCKNIEMQCPFYCPKTNLQWPHGLNIDESIEHGRLNKVCPFYLNSSAVKTADIILLPYYGFFTQSNGKFSDSIEESIIIIDEAHNLLDVLSEMDNAIISFYSLKDATQFCVWSRTAKFLQQELNLMSGISELATVCRSVLDFLNLCKESYCSTPSQFVIGSNIASFNLLKITRTITTYTITFMDKILSSCSDEDQTKKLYSILDSTNKVLSFLENLVKLTDDDFINISIIKDTPLTGKIVDRKIEIVPINVQNNIRRIVKFARSVIFTGGTLKPTDDLINLLLACGVDRERIWDMSCDHVISESQIFPAILKFGVNNSPFNFSYDFRKDKKMLRDLGKTFIHLCTKIPKGVIVFFPSYAMMNSVIDFWKTDGLVSEIEQRNKIFYEYAQSTEDKFVQYSEHIKSGHDGIYLSVIGGKYSEGINFSDDLARSVFIIGLPYANRADVSVSIRMEDLKLKKGNEAAMTFYRNACMRAVNQSIGRAIRHAGDFASIFLFDTRYQDTKISHLLPEWLASKTVIISSYGKLDRSLKEFYDENYHKYDSK